jgi:hypothetical protein
MSFYFKHINYDADVKYLVIYGSIQKETVRKPTEVFESNFGHAYCMAQDIAFKVERYIQGNGPDLIEFTQHIIDSCKTLSADVGFGETILFLSKNRWGKVWAEGAIKVSRFNNEARIFQPSDILKFTQFGNFDELLSTYSLPFEWSVEKTWESNEMLEELRKRGVLDFKVERSNWPKTPQPRRDEAQAYDEFYIVKMYKYIKLDTLLAYDF